MFGIFILGTLVLLFIVIPILLFFMGRVSARNRIRIKYMVIILFFSIISFVTWALVTERGNKLLSCWAYYDQCTAKRIEGITREECFKKEGGFVYYSGKELCLVKDK